MPGLTRIQHDVTDISSADQLLRFALAGQLALLEGRGYKQGVVAVGAGLGRESRSAGSAISRALQNGPRPQDLTGLDEIIGTLNPDLDDTGTLSSLALRLSAGRHGTIVASPLAARVPPSWTRKILADQPGDEIEVLLQASALLSEFMAAGKMGAANTITIRDRYHDELKLLVRRLILISAAPPTSRNHDAQILLGMLGGYALETVMDPLDSQLRYSPMGFRVWRAITKLVRVAEDGKHSDTLKNHSDTLKNWVRQLTQDSGRLRHYSLYAGRSLDLELAVTVPANWSPPGNDWASEALLARARDGNATLRERSTAAMGLWQRAAGQGRTEQRQARANLHQLIAEFKNPATRLDIKSGLQWLAVTLEHVMDAEVEVCNEWPDVNEDWFKHVQAAADELDEHGIPEHLLTGTKNLFRHMLLQNAGVHRREAIETVVTSGWTAPVAMALGSLLRAEQNETWLRIRAEFALGFLQRHRDLSVENDLVNACEHAYKNVQRGETTSEGVPRAHLTEMHASLFAVGDCFGVAGAGDQARKVRERLRYILTDLANADGARAERLRRPARAAAYLLTATAQPAVDGRKDLSEELLEKMSRYPDEPTARLSRWALSFRFAPDGEIRPFLAAAEFAEHDDDPWN